MAAPRHGSGRATAGDGRRCLVVRNVLVSYRWSQIFGAGSVSSDTTVCPARPVSDEQHAPWIPPPVDEVVEAIERVRPEVVFAAHVETAAGMVLPDDYVRALVAAAHGVGGLFVLDCIASGALWVDMTEPVSMSCSCAAEGVERFTVRGLRDARRGRSGGVMSTNSTSSRSTSRSG